MLQFKQVFQSKKAFRVKQFIASGLLAIATLSSAQAVEIAGVDVPASINIGNDVLQLNGAGVRSKFFMDLYVGSLYLPTKVNTAQEVLGAPQAMIRLNITSGMITSDKMRDAINEGFEAATEGNVAPIATQIQTFMGLFSAPITEGDQFSFYLSPTSVTSYKNGNELNVIESADFRNALLNIWFGEEPTQKSLKEAMLGE